MRTQGVRCSVRGMTPANTPRTRLVALAAAGVLALGLAVGFLPLSAYGVTCGSAFVDSAEPFRADLRDTLGGAGLRTGVVGGISAACHDRRAAWRNVAVLVLAAGGAGGVGAGWLAYSTRRRASPDAATSR
jgi:hypothetical protein